MKMFVLFISCLILTTSAAPTGQDDPDCGSKPADVVFVLDASANIHHRQFRSMQGFIRDVVSQFEVSPSKTRVGLITYGEIVQEVISLASPYSDNMNLITAISNIYKFNGPTYTDRALIHAREMIRREGRSDVPKMVIVLTNGRSQFPQLTRDEAQTTKKNDIIIFSIGTGHHMDNGELMNIASKKDYVYTANDLKALEAIREVLANEACGIQGDSPYGGNNRQDPYYYQNAIIKEGKPGKLEKTCGGRPAEIVFCLDASGSIWGPDFDRQLKFVSDIVGVFQIAPNMTRIGALTFGDHPKDWFKLNSYNYEDDVKAAINGIYQMRGGTNTAAALSTMKEDHFADSLVRPDVVKIAIVITDGRSQDMTETARQAAMLREKGVYVFAIGVGIGLKIDELNLISSQPAKEYVFKVENYQALETIKNILSLKTCQVTLPPTTEPPITACGDRRPADIVFSMPPDADAAQAAKIISLMKKIANGMDMGEDAVKMGLAPKECIALPGLELTGDFDTTLLLGKLNEGYAAAHTPRLIRYLRKEGFAPENGGRKEAQKMAVIILDKSSPNYASAAAEAEKAKKMGVEIFIIAIGDDITDEELSLVASSPVDDHVIRVDSYSELADIADKLIEMINRSCVEFIPLQLQEDIHEAIKEKIKTGPLNKIDLFSGL